MCFFFFKQKTAYEMRISDWSSDVCSSDLTDLRGGEIEFPQAHEACTIEPLHLVAAGEKTLPPGLERIGIVEPQDFDVGYEQAGALDGRQHLGQGRDIAAGEDVSGDPRIGDAGRVGEIGRAHV